MRMYAPLVGRFAVIATVGVSVVAAQPQPRPYTEPLRPRIHFTPARHFMNDPNGLVYYKGEYHLFYQHNPQGPTWGHMSWGHAVSRDLLHWQHLPLALGEENGIMIFSGSAVVDHRNTSGLCRVSGGDPSCLVAIYTGHSRDTQTQNLAVSQDRGRTWQKYAGNPVIDIGLREFRDPKVFWHAPTARWVMVVALPDEHKVRFYASRDLKAWTFLSDFGPAGATGGVWECPDLMQVPVEHDPTQSRWVLDVDVNPGGPQGGSGGQYFVGDFDGTRFVSDTPASAEALWADHGKDFYASISFSDLPSQDRGPIWMGWISNWQYANDEPTMTWRGAQSIPRRLRVRRTPDGWRLLQQPAGGLGTLVAGDARKHQELRSTPLPLPPSADITFVVTAGDTEDVGLRFSNDNGEEAIVAVSADHRTLSIDRERSRLGESSKGYAERHTAPLRPSAQIPIRVIFDVSVIEVFANEGETVMTDRVYPTRPFTRVEWLGGRRPASGATRLLALDSAW